MSYMRGGVGSSRLLNSALQQKSYSTDAQAVETEVFRNPANQYLSLSSKDRNQSASTGNNSSAPWNQFRLQKPQSMMNSFATRMLVSEIRFPWYIPNINANNRVGQINVIVGGNLVAQPIEIPTGFYTPAQLVLWWSGAIPSPAPQLEYDATNGQFALISQGSDFTIAPWDVGQQVLATNNNHYPTSDRGYLWETLGFQKYVDVPVSNPNTFALFGDPVPFVYTSYVDIVSDKLNQYSSTRDGSSDNKISANLVCRVYCADEISFVSATQAQPGQVLSLIHRQFKNPKSVMWNKEAVVDWLDISVFDEYGFLVPLPTTGYSNSAINFKTPGAYPDFQITLLASEN